MYNVVNTLAPSDLIGSFSFLQVARAAMKSWMGLKLDKIRLVPLESAALAGLDKIPICLYCKKCCWNCSAFNFDGSCHSCR